MKRIWLLSRVYEGYRCVPYIIACPTECVNAPECVPKQAMLQNNISRHVSNTPGAYPRLVANAWANGPLINPYQWLEGYLFLPGQAPRRIAWFTPEPQPGHQTLDIGSTLNPVDTQRLWSTPCSHRGHYTYIT